VIPKLKGQVHLHQQHSLHTTWMLEGPAKDFNALIYQELKLIDRINLLCIYDMECCLWGEAQTHVGAAHGNVHHDYLM